MKLENIDKTTYRKHLNRVIAGSAIAFAALAIGLAQATIFLFTDREGSHFAINLSGVIVAMIIVGTVLNKIKHHPYMYEVYYVWRLKQQINYITRKLKAVETAADQNDPKAIHTLYFYYKACRQLYLLDDNTIIMDELSVKSAALDSKIDDLNLTLDASDYQQAWLDAF